MTVLMFDRRYMSLLDNFQAELAKGSKYFNAGGQQLNVAAGSVELLAQGRQGAIPDLGRDRVGRCPTRNCLAARHACGQPSVAWLLRFLALLWRVVARMLVCP
jgi:hypothetical protein